MSAFRKKVKSPERFEPAASRFHGVGVNHCATRATLKQIEVLNIYEYAVS